MGVDIVTEPQRPQGGRFARWARNGIISLGLTGLVALSYHAAVAPATDTSGQHGHSAGELVSWQRTLPSQASTPASVPAGSAARPDRADPADPANRPQTSLQDAAGREHPEAGSHRPDVPQGPPPAARGRVLPSEVLEGGASTLGGCLKEYGENGQCVPVVPPSLAQHVQDMKKSGGNPNAMEHRWSCTELRKYFQDGVAVRQGGIDPQNLDANGDGKACAAGDS